MSVERARGELGRFQRGVLVCPDARLRLPVREALGTRMDLTDLGGPEGYPDLAAILSAGPELCLVDVGTHAATALDLVRQVSEAGIPVIALHQSSQPDLILEALRAGAGEFLFDPIDPQHLANAVARLARKPAPAAPPPRGKVWVVLPAKGVGLSTVVSCHLAELLARRRDVRVLLADMDPLQGSVGFLLKLKTPFSMADALADPAHLERDLWKQVTARHAGMDVLVAPEQPQLDRFDPAGAPALFEFLRRHYEVTVADSPGLVSPWQLQLALRCDELLLVMGHDVAAVQATQRTLRLLEAEGMAGSRIRLLLDGSRRATGLSRESIEAALQREVFHILPNDGEAAQTAALEGKPMAADSAMGKSLDALCDRLLGVTPPVLKKSVSWHKFFLKKQPVG